jgi:hypothetical protein
VASDFRRTGKNQAGTGRRRMGAVVGSAPALLLALQTISCSGGSSGMQTPPPSPTFTTIDVPGAGGTTPQGTFAIGLDSNGDVVGYFIDGNNNIHGFIRDSGGAITTVDAPGANAGQGLGTEVTGINSSGEAAGFYSDSQQILHSFIRTSGGMLTEFDPPSATGSDAFCINDGGGVAGGVLDVNGSHGFVRAADGSFTIFDPTGNASQVSAVFPIQINASGAIAGTYSDTNFVNHGFFRDANGTETVFDATGAGTAFGEGTQAYDVNSSGVIVGGVTTGFVGGVATSHSYIRNSDGTFTVFDPAMAGPSGSIADGINDSGTIIGEFRDANLVNHGYLRNADGAFVVLEDPSAAQLPISFTNLGTVPRRINPSGAVAGLFSDPAGLRHAFIWQ